MDDILPDESNNGVQVEDLTLNELGRRIDAIGRQMDWLVENLASLFGFVQQMSQSGGGVRGMLHALKHAPPEIKQQLETSNDDA